MHGVLHHVLHDIDLQINICGVLHFDKIKTIKIVEIVKIMKELDMC